MLIYQANKDSFLKSVANDTLTDQIDQVLKEKMNIRTGDSERRSWQNSMQYMFHVLSNDQIPSDAGVAIEYNIPHTNKRVDFMISGYDEARKPNVVVIELKQWEKVKEVRGKEALVETYTGHGFRQVVHPSYQVSSYVQVIKDYNTSVQDRSIGLYPCAFLHNYRIEDQNSDPLLASQYQEYIKEAPVYLKGQGAYLAEMIHEYIFTGDDQEILKDIDYGKIRPSKSLQDAISSVMEGNQEFTMLDDQKVAYETILQESEEAKESGQKHVVVVKGGPGTGKSVIAINLLANLTKKGQVAQYVTKTSSPRQVYAAKLAKGGKKVMPKSRFEALFKGSGTFIDAPRNSVDTILCDEAHRLNEKTGPFRKGENQIKEIINAAKCSVFFLDENQRVTFSDYGNLQRIREFADQAGAYVTVLELNSQFRCNGSDGYLAWLDNTLEIRETANFNLENIDFDIRVFDTPEEVYEQIQKRNDENNNSRMVAGYCWEWDSKHRDDPNQSDIVIGDFQMSWNLGDSIFALDKGSIDQVGCIHTTQGLEFDYVGVIIGNDMRYEEGHVVTDASKRAKSDNSLNGYKKLLKTDPEKAKKKADEIIKNTYRTLMTRGMKGCYIYCCDDELKEYLRLSINAY
ncbi:DUF2075 domain-containing protein [Allobaculum mucilyticum]|uniref:DUF2075 domain-containing protein n=1 Tax=Allobaculum mucilyticum TaxID=2834459 RepID=UPI001E637B2B|nr:DUF2075 domain-containing protein [Allobaculum mucilyticum]UNT96289.1 DUF2075 domain-containing protein [Allobaculum mucilyticum]